MPHNILHLNYSHVSREKTFELLVELWNDETNQQPFAAAQRGDNLSPGRATAYIIR